MKALKIGGIVVGALTILVVGIGLFLPERYEVQRTKTISATREVVFELINNVEQRNRWSPWKKADPTMQITYGETRAGVGAWYSWTSDHSGAGTLTIVSSKPPEELTTRVAFKEHLAIEGVWRLEEKADACDVTWGMRGQAHGILHRWVALAMDAIVGYNFEQGLAELKQVAEAAPRPAPPTPNPGG